MGRDTLILFPGVYLNSRPFFQQDDEEFLVGVANGMPGMSGGPIFFGQLVVSVITGGGTASSPTQLIGTGVPLRALRAFVAKVGADRH